MLRINTQGAFVFKSYEGHLKDIHKEARTVIDERLVKQINRERDYSPTNASLNEDVFKSKLKDDCQRDIIKCGRLIYGTMLYADNIPDKDIRNKYIQDHRPLIQQYKSIEEKATDTKLFAIPNLTEKWTKEKENAIKIYDQYKKSPDIGDIRPNNLQELIIKLITVSCEYTKDATEHHIQAQTGYPEDKEYTQKLVEAYDIQKKLGISQEELSIGMNLIEQGKDPFEYLSTAVNIKFSKDQKQIERDGALYNAVNNIAINKYHDTLRLGFESMLKNYS